MSMYHRIDKILSMVFYISDRMVSMVFEPQNFIAQAINDRFQVPQKMQIASLQAMVKKKVHEFYKMYLKSHEDHDNNSPSQISV